MVYITHIFEFIYLYNSRSAELYWTKVMKRLIKCMCTLCTLYTSVYKVMHPGNSGLLQFSVITPSSALDFPNLTINGLDLFRNTTLWLCLPVQLHFTFTHNEAHIIDLLKYI